MMILGEGRDPSPTVGRFVRLEPGDPAVVGQAVLDLDAVVALAAFGRAVRVVVSSRSKREITPAPLTAIGHRASPGIRPQRPGVSTHPRQGFRGLSAPSLRPPTRSTGRGSSILSHGRL